MGSSPAVVPVSTIRHMSQQARGRYLSTISAHQKKAFEDYSNRIISKAAWLVALENKAGYTPERIQKEYLFENFPQNGIEYDKEELERNDSFLLFIPGAIDGQDITLKFFERLGFRFTFNDHVYGYQNIGEQFSSAPAPKGIFIVRANVYPDSTNKCLNKQRKLIPNGYQFSHPMVEITKNILLTSLGHDVNKNILARCVCWDTDRVSIIGGVDNSDKKIFFYADDNSLSGKCIGASMAKSIFK